MSAPSQDRGPPEATQPEPLARRGPLRDLRVVELTGIGPGPFAAMLLADMGADVVRLDRVTPGGLLPTGELDVLARGRRSIAVDVKQPEGLEVALRLADRADALLEGFRPGVAERLGIGPDDCRKRNPRLVYGRITGWGQDGPLASLAGHDLTYAAIAGALHPIGPADRPPVVPLNYVADFGGGGMLLAFGVLCALLERERSGRGQVVDAAMVDGTALLTAMFHGLRAAGLWRDEREANLLDGGMPYYRCYRCRDDRFLAVGCLEPQFHDEFLRLLGIDPATWPQHDPERWAAQHAELEERFAARTRDEWAALFAGTDACVAPVLGLDEAPAHEHLRARGTFVEHEGLVQPSPAPRFSRSRTGLSRPPVLPGQHTEEVLTEVGYPAAQITALRQKGIIH